MPTLCSYNSLNSSGKAFRKALEYVYGNIWPFLQNCICEIRQWYWPRSPPLQSHTIIQPPPNCNFVSLQSDSTVLLSFSYQLQTHPSGCQMVRHDSSLLRTHLHCFRIQWWCVLHRCVPTFVLRFRLWLLNFETTFLVVSRLWTLLAALWNKP